MGRCGLFPKIESTTIHNHRLLPRNFGFKKRKEGRKEGERRKKKKK